MIKKHLNIFFWGGSVVFRSVGVPLPPLRVPGDVPGRAEVGVPSELSRCLLWPWEAGSTLMWPPGRGGEKGLCLVLSPDQPGHHRPWLSLAVKGQEGALPIKVHFCEAGEAGVQGTGSSPLSPSGSLITGVSGNPSRRSLVHVPHGHFVKVMPASPVYQDFVIVGPSSCVWIHLKIEGN